MERTRVDKCVLFADIAGSTRMYTDWGDDETQRLLHECLDLMDVIVREGKGHVARRIGDELLCTFANTDDAALTSMRLHHDVSTEGAFARPMRLRIGFEYGSIIEASGALYGNTVHMAARVASLAKAGQTLTTKATLDHLGTHLRCFTRFVDSAMFKGVAGEQEIHELVWSVPEATIGSKRPSTPRAAPSEGYVELEYRGRTFRVDAGRPSVEIGRDPSCDLCVEGPSVSHVHARIHWDRGRVKLEDVSMNGTMVVREKADPLQVRRERVSLLGAGLLHLGDAEDELAQAVVRYRCRD